MHRQPIYPPRFLAHALTEATLYRHSTQQAIAYHEGIGGKFAVHEEALYWIKLGLAWGHVVCVALNQQHRLLVWPAQKQEQCLHHSHPACGSFQARSEDQHNVVPTGMIAELKCHFAAMAILIEAVKDLPNVLVVSNSSWWTWCHAASKRVWPISKCPCCCHNDGDVPVGMQNWSCASGWPD